MRTALGNGLLLLGLAATLLVPVPAPAAHLSVVEVITADQLKTWIDQGRKILLIDARVASEFKEAHIPTAINIPAPLMDQLRDKLPQDHEYPLVFYCNGWPECKKSHEASSKAVEWGNKKVYWFRDGIPVWESKGYPVE